MPGRGRHHTGIGHGVDQAVGARGIERSDTEFRIDHEAPPDLGLMVHHAMTRVDATPVIKIVCRSSSSSIAAATSQACTVSQHHGVRDDWHALSRGQNMRRDRAAAPLCGSDGVMVLMKALARCPDQQGQNRIRAVHRAGPAPSCLLRVLPKPMPGSSTMAAGNARPCRDVERGGEKCLDIG